MAIDEKWVLKISTEAEEEISHLPADAATQTLDSIIDLGEDPFPPGSIRLRGWNNLYRIRVAGYRIIYRVNPRRKTVLVERVRSREVAYLGLER